MYKARKGLQSYRPRRRKPKSYLPSVRKQTASNTKAIKAIRKNQNQKIYYKAEFSEPIKGIPWTVIPLMGGPSSGDSGGVQGGDDASSIWEGSFNDSNGTNVGHLKWHEQFGTNDNTYAEDQTLKVNSLTMDFQVVPGSENELVNYSIFIVSLKKEAIAALNRPFVYDPPSDYRQGTQSSNNDVGLGGCIMTALASGTHYYNDQQPNSQLVSSGGAFTRLNPKYFKIHKEWRINTEGSAGSAGGPAAEEQNQLITNGSMGYFRRRYHLRCGNTIKNTAGSITMQPPNAIPIKDRKWMLVFHDGYNADAEYSTFSLLVGYNCQTQA